MRRTTIFTLLLFMGGFYLHAQVSQGTLLLGTTTSLGGGIIQQNLSPGSVPNGGGFGFYKNTYEFNGQKLDSEKVSYFSLSPRVGYFLADGLAAGIRMDFNRLKFKDEDLDYDYSVNSFAAGPFLRYYFDMGKVRPFLEAEAVFGTVNEKDSDGDEYTSNITLFGGGAGVAVFLNNFLSFDVLVGYHRLQNKDEDDDKNILSGVGVGLGFSLFLNSGGGED